MIDAHHPLLASDTQYRLADASNVLTPALAIYPAIVDANIAATLRLVGGNPNRWRPHVKTVKLAYVERRMVAAGVTACKCATTLELATACEAGFTDVLLAFAVVGPHVKRVRQIAARHPRALISALVESERQIRQWSGTPIGVFLDVNSGMNRTGVEQAHTDAILDLARIAADAGVELRGLHYYDGHLARYDDKAERETLAHRGYDRLIELVAALNDAGFPVAEVVTAGTPTLPASLSYPHFAGASFLHRVSPGTVVYADCTSLGQLPAEYGYRPAVVVVSTVISRPTPDRVTCDAGAKSLAADMGAPTCLALGHPELAPQHLSEEHQPMLIEPGATPPAIGDILYLVPRHVCPTVNNFDNALIVEDGRVTGVERVTARGHEGPLLEASSAGC
jgi:D-serine deaminase-like pyridoxal phosphate-dependent protein